MAGSKMRDPDIRRLRALAMLHRRMANISRAAIAEEFNVLPATVDKEMDWAKKQGLIQNYENQILNDLVPDAIKTVKAAVADGNVKAALEVLKGTGLLTTRPAAPQPSTPDGGAESLEIYVRKIKPISGESNEFVLGGSAAAALPTVREVALNPAGSTSTPDSGGDDQDSVVDATPLTA